MESFSVSSHHLLSACDTQGIEPGASHLFCHLISQHPMSCSFNLLVSRQTQESAACPRSCIRVWVRIHDSQITQKKRVPTFLHICHIKICTEQNKTDVLISYFVLYIILTYSKWWFHFEVNRTSMVRPNLMMQREMKNRPTFSAFL